MDAASVCGRRAGKVERRRSDGGNRAGAQRRRRAADGSPPLMWPLELPLATNVSFEQRNGQGWWGTGQPSAVKRSKGHAGRGESEQ